MRRGRRKLQMLAFSTSLLVHAFLLIGLPLALEATADDREPAPPEPLAMAMPVEIELGIEAQNPPTPTWVGFDEPQPQLAEQSIVEQAAFIDEPVAAAPPPQTPKPETEPTPEPTPNEAPADETQPVEESSSHQVQPEELATPQEIAEPRELAERSPLVDVITDLLEQVQATIRNRVAETSDRPADEANPESSPPRETQEQDQPLPQPPQPQPSQEQPQIAPTEEKAQREVGTPSDKESSPTSLIEVPRDQWQLGKPLARHGLTLKPRRPEFTLLTLLTAAPGNPHCQISFGRDGVPLNAKLLRTSGDSRVDDAIVASLYRWRAEGEELEKLAPGRALDVKMRIILNRRAASDEES